MKNFKNKMIPPTFVSLLGGAGLIPFVALSKPGQDLMMNENDEYYWKQNRHTNTDVLQKMGTAIGRTSLNPTELQVTYGCMILTFLGGPHWGFVMARHVATKNPGLASSILRRPPQLSTIESMRLVWGVLPSLLAWPCASIPAPKSLDLVSVGLISAFVIDTLCWISKLVPAYYFTIRLPLTIVAVASLQSNK